MGQQPRDGAQLIGNNYFTVEFLIIRIPSFPGQGAKFRTVTYIVM